MSTYPCPSCVDSGDRGGLMKSESSGFAARFALFVGLSYLQIDAPAAGSLAMCTCIGLAMWCSPMQDEEGATWHIEQVFLLSKFRLFSIGSHSSRSDKRSRAPVFNLVLLRSTLERYLGGSARSASVSCKVISGGVDCWQVACRQMGSCRCYTDAFTLDGRMISIDPSEALP